jgi:MFS superfamily sulfate permease-like transporter
LHSRDPGFGEIVVLRLRNMTAIDATGLKAIEDFSDALERAGRTLLLVRGAAAAVALMDEAEFHRTSARRTSCRAWMRRSRERDRSTSALRSAPTPAPGVNGEGAGLVGAGADPAHGVAHLQRGREDLADRHDALQLVAADGLEARGGDAAAVGAVRGCLPAGTG